MRDLTLWHNLLEVCDLQGRISKSGSAEVNTHLLRGRMLFITNENQLHVLYLQLLIEQYKLLYDGGEELTESFVLPCLCILLLLCQVMYIEKIKGILDLDLSSEVG